VDKALVIQNLSKTFPQDHQKSVKALDDVSFEIKAGQIFGLLGPNGAGKSTLINLMSGVMLPDQGTMTLFGHDIVNESLMTKQMIGVVPQDVVIEAAFTVEEVLYYFAGMYGVPSQERKKRIAQILEDLSLSDKKDEKSRSLSGGMKRRLMIAKAIIHQPKLLILDEPTAGVDVALRKKTWELVRRLNEAGTTIIFTTHYLEEAEELCDFITLINHGKVIQQGKLEELQKGFGSQNLIYFDLFEHNIEHLTGVQKNGHEYEYPVTNLAEDLDKISKFYSLNLKSIRNEAASLEKIFLELTKS
jgi:ABC-2 type transport system ATP-binding protein